MPITSLSLSDYAPPRMAERPPRAVVESEPPTVVEPPPRALVEFKSPAVAEPSPRALVEFKSPAVAEPSPSSHGETESSKVLEPSSPARADVEPPTLVDRPAPTVAADDLSQLVERPPRGVSAAVGIHLLDALQSLADLLGSATDTLNQCVLTVEGKLEALSVAQEQWVPIPGDSVSTDGGADSSNGPQERVFDGVPVMILKLDPPDSEPGPMKRSEAECHLGYACVDGVWGLSVGRRPQNGVGVASQRLLDAPLETRFRAIREIPNLIRLLDR